MNPGISDPADNSSSPPEDTPVQQVRAQFEEAWWSAESADSRPRINEFLAEVPEPERSIVFCTLLSLELKWRQDQGEHPTPGEYFSLYPEATTLIRSVFEKAASHQNGQTVSISQPPVGSQALTVSFEKGTATKPGSVDGLGGSHVAGGPGSRTTDPLTDQKNSRRSLKVPFPEVPGYLILKELGRGGMGIVYKARHLRLNRLVALKMILPGQMLSASVLDRFHAEARVVAQFQHVSIVQIYEIGPKGAPPYLSLELIEGGSLSKKLAGTPQSAAYAAATLETLARAMDYAHRKGVVHRDLKPGNILLTADGAVKVTDFGLAKETTEDSNDTDKGWIVGTPSYMAPEQAAGKSNEVTQAADIYALGVILYEMLTGHPPFKAAEKWQTLELVKNAEPVPPRRLVPQVPRDLELICLKCLKKDPAQRFATGAELADELRRYIDGRPILTRPTPMWEQAWKWTRRKPAVASLIVVSTAALLIALCSIFIYLDQQAHAAQRELAEGQRVGQRRDQVNELRNVARGAIERGDHDRAQGPLTAALEIVAEEPLLAVLKPDLEKLQQDVKGRKDAAERTAKFFQHRDIALRHGLVFTGVDLAPNVARTIGACKSGLALFGVEPGAGPVFPDSMSEGQKKQCRGVCYELLLVWAEAEAPDADTEPTKRQAEFALTLLDRANQLGLPTTKAYHTRRARYLELTNKKKQAVEERNLAAKAAIGGSLDHFLIGMSHQKRGHLPGELAKAEAAFAAALVVEADHFWARYFLALCNLQMGNFKLARDNLTGCIGSRKGEFWLHQYRGLASRLLDDFRAAEIDFEIARSLNPDPQALHGIIVNQGASCLREAELLAAGTPAPWLLPLAPNLEFVARGAAEVCRHERLKAAATFLTDAKARQEAQYPAYHYLALVRQQQKEPVEAIALLDAAIEKAKNQGPRVRSLLYGHRARLHRELDDLDAALDDLAIALKDFPNAADYAECGLILQIRSEPKKAVEAFNLALAFSNCKTEVYLLKAKALIAANADPKAVVDTLDQYEGKAGKLNAEMHRVRGLANARLRRFQAALADYHAALALEPDSASYAARGWIFLAHGVRKLAFEDFEEAIHLDNGNGEAYAGRGLIHVRENKNALGLADAEAALQNAGANPSRRLLWNVAHIYAQAGAEPGVQTMKEISARISHRNMAVATLREALARQDDLDPAAFWREFVAEDALLDPIRRHPGFQEMQKQHGQPAGARSSFK